MQLKINIKSTAIILYSISNRLSADVYYQLTQHLLCLCRIWIKTWNFVTLRCFVSPCIVLNWTSRVLKWWLKMTGLILAYFIFISLFFLVWKWCLWSTEFYLCCFLFSRASLIVYTMFQLRRDWVRTPHWLIILCFDPIIIVYYHACLFTRKSPLITTK